MKDDPHSVAGEQTSALKTPQKAADEQIVRGILAKTEAKVMEFGVFMDADFLRDLSYYLIYVLLLSSNAKTDREWRFDTIARILVIVPEALIEGYTRINNYRNRVSKEYPAIREQVERIIDHVTAAHMAASYSQKPVVAAPPRNLSLRRGGGITRRERTGLASHQPASPKTELPVTEVKAPPPPKLVIDALKELASFPLVQKGEAAGLAILGLEATFRDFRNHPIVSELQLTEASLWNYLMGEALPSATQATIASAVNRMGEGKKTLKERKGPPKDIEKKPAQAQPAAAVVMPKAEPTAEEKEALRKRRLDSFPYAAEHLKPLLAALKAKWPSIETIDQVIARGRILASTSADKTMPVNVLKALDAAELAALFGGKLEIVRFNPGHSAPSWLPLAEALAKVAGLPPEKAYAVQMFAELQRMKAEEPTTPKPKGRPPTTPAEEPGGTH